MDLIPSDFRKSQRTRHFLRSTLLAVVLILGVLGLARLALEMLISADQARIAQLRERDGSSQRQQSVLAGLRQRKQQIEQQLATLASLRGSERVASLLRGLDAAFVDGVWLETLRLAQSLPDDAAAGKPGAPAVAPAPAAGAAAGGPGSGGKVASGIHSAEITGHALDHTRLAGFMRTLGAQPGIAQLVLVDSRARPQGSGEGVDFTLALQVHTGGAAP